MRKGQGTGSGGTTPSRQSEVERQSGSPGHAAAHHTLQGHAKADGVAKRLLEARINTGQGGGQGESSARSTSLCGYSMGAAVASYW